MTQPISVTQTNGREPFLGFVTDDPSLDVLQSVIAQTGGRTDVCKKGGLRTAVQALSVATSPAMLMIDLSECADPLHEIDTLAEVCEPGTIVLAVGRINDIALYRDLVARGIHDYLVKPLSSGQLLDALERAHKAMAGPREQGGEADRKHLSVAVVGTRGGVGASMLATSLAWLLSSEHRCSTALLDLDIHFGTGALTLDLEPGRGLPDAIEDPLRIDGLFIERALVRAGERLAIMSAEAPLNAGLVTDGSAFIRLEQEFRQSFEATVIDLPRSIMLNFPHLLAEVNTIVLTAELTLASARDAIRLLSWLKSNAPTARIVMVANKVPSSPGEISQADFTAAIEREIDFSIALDPKAAIQAARLGQTFAQANQAGKTAAPLIDLARSVAQPGAVPQNADGTADKAGSLLGRFDWKTLLSKLQKPAGRTA